MKHLLLLEEDREGRELLARVLKRRGFRVIQAGDERAARAILMSDRPVDLVLAGATFRDRLEFLSDLRERGLRLPVIFLSDYCGPESRLRGMLGAFSLSRALNFYINTRPIRLQELDRVIRIALNSTRGGCRTRYPAAA